MTAEPNADYAKKLRVLAEEMADQSCQIIVGGRQLSDAILRLNMDNLHTARSMVELQSFSKGLLAAYKTTRFRGLKTGRKTVFTTALNTEPA